MKFNYYIKSECISILLILREKWNVDKAGSSIIIGGDDIYYMGVNIMNRERRKDIEYWGCSLKKININYE